MKKVIVFLVFMSQLMGYGQDPVSGIDLTQPTKAEIGMATTPEVAGLGRFGDLNINTSIGLLNHTIPIFTIKLKNYELPISLSYTYSGLRVEDESGIAGLGWNLNAGGFISREVRGLAPDENGYYNNADKIKRYYFGNYLHYPNIQELDDGDALNLGAMAAVNSMVYLWGDTQPDKFTFNISGLEGHYTHSLNRKPILFPLKPYYIEDCITTNNYAYRDSIKVINEKGILFDFNKTVFGNLSYDQGPGYYFPTEWWISKIEEPNTNKTISFDYYDGNDFGLTGNVPYTKKTYNERYIEETTYVQGDGSSKKTDHASGDMEDILQRTFIKTIYFPEGKVTFDISKHQANNPGLFNEIYNLDKIIVYTKKNQGTYQKLFTYEFVYDDPASSRKLLLQIIKKDSLDRTIPFYQFEYNVNAEDNNMVPENIDKKSQDYWGYYNGKWNSALLKIIDEDVDRNPDFQNTLIGSLKKIIYPTGGYSQINYEQNDYYVGELPCEDRYTGSDVLFKSFMNLVKSDGTYESRDAGTDYGSPVTHTDSIPIIDSIQTVYSSNFWHLVPPPGPPSGPMEARVYEMKDTIHFTNSQKVNADYIVHMGLETIFSNGIVSLDFSKPVEALCNNTYIDSLRGINWFHTSDSPDGWYYASTQYNIPENTDMYISIKYIRVYASDDSFDRFFNGSVTISKIDSLPMYINKPAGGLRVASYKSCPDDTGQHCVQHHYKYRTPDGISTGKTHKAFKLGAHAFYQESMDVNTDTYSSVRTVTEYVYSDVVLSSLLGSFTLYNRVEHFIKNDSIAGKTINYYDNDFLDNHYLGRTFIDNAWKYGKLLQKEVYKYNNTTNHFEITKKINNTYQSVFPYGIDPDTLQLSIGATAGIKGSLLVGETYSDLIERPGVYEIRPELYNLVKTEETDYFNQEELHKITHYYYDPYTGNLIQKKTYDSDGDDLTISYQYPNSVTDINSLGNPPLTSSQYAAYQHMKSPNIDHPNYQNRVGEPIQISSDRAGHTLSKKIRRMTVKNLGPLFDDTDNPIPNKDRLVYDQILEGQMGQSLEPRVIYHNYDSYGNPTEVSQPDGTHIYYIYGYQHNKPIAKIVNFTQADAENLQAQIAAAITASDNDEDAVSEAALRTALDNLRQALPDNTQITTYTYDPLIGITSITDPKGDTQYYIYDSFNRLKYIKDKDGHILKEHEYHYRE